MIETRWVARVRPNTRGYPLLERAVWYPVRSSDEVGCLVEQWGRQIFIFNQDAEFKLTEPKSAGLIG